MGMWWRLNRKESNQLMKECVKDQINLNLPWILELNSIASQLEIDLVCAKELSKEQWKTLVKGKVLVKAQQYLQTEIEELKGYRNNIQDEISIGKKKRYVALTQKKAKVWFRMRANLIDPTPREPYSSTIWKCKFCHEREQSTEHYVLRCTSIKEEIFLNYDREYIFQIIQTLDCDDQTFFDITCILTKLYQLITE